MINWFKKEKSNSLIAVSTGELSPLSAVPDEAFSSLAVGDGVAITPLKSEVSAPISGTLSMIFPTKHAFGITTNDGIEVLVHMGIDTVKLKGKGFRIEKEINQQVNAGDVVAKMDLEFIKHHGYNPVIMVIVTNKSRYQFSYEKSGIVTRGRSVIGKFMLDDKDEKM